MISEQELDHKQLKRLEEIYYIETVCLFLTGIKMDDQVMESLILNGTIIYLFFFIEKKKKKRERPHEEKQNIQIQL